MRQRRIGAADDVHRGQPGRRNDVVVDVDAMRLGLCQDLRSINTAGSSRDHRGATDEELTAAHASRGKLLLAACAAGGQTASDR